MDLFAFVSEVEIIYGLVNIIYYVRTVFEKWHEKSVEMSLA